MRVNDEVRHNALSCEWKVLLPVEHAHSTLLSMSAGKLITDLRDALGPHLDLSKSLAKLIHSYGDLLFNPVGRGTTTQSEEEAGCRREP